MSLAYRTPPAGGAFFRRFTRYSGLFFDELSEDSAWIREEARVQLPALAGVDTLVVRGEFRPHAGARGLEAGAPGLRAELSGHPPVVLSPSALRRPVGAKEGPWQIRLPLAEADRSRDDLILSLRLTGVRATNALAWLGRVTGWGPWQRFRGQRRNRQLRILAIEAGDGEAIYDFSRRHAPYSAAFARRHTQLGLNIVGFLTADLGLGESARCMVRAADAAGIPAALVPLKLNCKNPLGDPTYAERLRDDNPHGVNVVHLDPPAARDLDHHHGEGFRRGKYNIGFFAWELPEFPDAWLPAFDYFDEIWCPSDFTGAAVALKSPLPVLTLPHAIAFARPTTDRAALRARWGLPAADFLFLALFDLNSYTARKNPQAAIEAFRRSGLAGRGATLVLKIHNTTGNAADYSVVRAAVRDLPGTVLLTETFSRADVYALEAACDSLVSLHRSEGFGLAVAECMYLGLPVISTDWSATAEYVNVDNGCPVRSRLAVLEHSHGPYAKGSSWAEPDIDQAAEWMRRLFFDRTLAAKLGAAGRGTIESRFAPAIVGARYRRRLEAIACF